MLHSFSHPTRYRAPSAEQAGPAHTVYITTLRAQREEAVAALGRREIAALVLTLRAGSVGLNLTAASRVVFVSPCLDASVRRQAISRCHRFGQTERVIVTDVVMDGTLEVRALSLVTGKEFPPKVRLFVSATFDLERFLLGTAIPFNRAQPTLLLFP
jgi:hypothetical protein